MLNDDLKCLVENYIPYDQENEVSQLKTLTFLNTENDWFGKSNLSGHITASVWIVNRSYTRTFLTHHKKLEKWIQLGGHTEPGETIWQSAIREAKEESKMLTIELSDTNVFDLDVHWIPAYKGSPGHWHYDLRFLVVADDQQAYGVTDESHAVQWVELEQVQGLTQEVSVLRMVEKTIKLR